MRLQCCGVLRGVVIWSLSKMGQSQIADVQHLCLKILHSEQITTGGTCLLGRWPEWQCKFAEFMVHELGANEKTLEDIDVKAAPNTNGKFSKSDVAAENATLPDETPVLQYSLKRAFLRHRDQCR